MTRPSARYRPRVPTVPAHEPTWHVPYELADGVPRVAHVQAPQACDARRTVLRIARRAGHVVASVGEAMIGGREPAEGGAT